MRRGVNRDPVPGLTYEARTAALGKAMRARMRRTMVLENVRTGAVSVPEVVAMGDSDEAVGAMRVFTLLRAVPGYGFSTARRLMALIGISESRRIRGLGCRQREALADMFGGAE